MTKNVSSPQNYSESNADLADSGEFIQAVFADDLRYSSSQQTEIDPQMSKSRLFSEPWKITISNMSSALLSTSIIFLLACSPEVPQGEEVPESEVRPAFGDALSTNATLKDILRHPDILQRSERVSQFLQRASSDQLEDIKAEFRIAPLDQGDIEYALFASWWARFDPTGAYVFADHEIRMEQPRVITAVMRTWAQMDPEGLMSSNLFTSATSKMPSFRGAIADSVVSGWFTSGKPGLAEFVLTQPDPETQQMALKAWMRMKVLRDGGRAAFEWTQSLPYHADIKRHLLASGMAIVAHQNPQLCIEWLDTARENGIDIGTFVPRIASAWGHHDPQAAIDWVLDYGTTADRFRAIQRISRKWRRLDPQGMLDWVDTKSEALDQTTIYLLRFQALQMIIERNQYRDVNWLDLLDRTGKNVSGNQRDIAVLYILQRFYVADQPAAEAWIKANPLGVTEFVLGEAHLLDGESRGKIEIALGRAL